MIAKKPTATVPAAAAAAAAATPAAAAAGEQCTILNDFLKSFS